MVKVISIFLIGIEILLIACLYHFDMDIRFIKISMAATVLTFIYLECHIVLEGLKDKYQEKQS